MTLRLLVVDDEPPARDRLCRLLRAEPGVQVVGEAGNGPDAVEAIRGLRPDLVLLDVQMPGLTGFDVIEAVGPAEMPAVVFVTAYDAFAVDAFDVEAVDYLLKPVSAPRLRKALERARTRRAGPAPRFGAGLERVLERVAAGRGRLERFVVAEAGRVLLVPAADVVRLTADGNYVRLTTRRGARHLVRATLASLEARLDPARFTRVHRSDLVAVDAVTELRPLFHGDYEVVLVTGETLRLSRRYRTGLLGTDPGSLDSE